MATPYPAADADLIGAYLRDRLDEGRRCDFERRLLEDPTLLEHVELDLLLRQVLVEPALLRALVAALPDPGRQIRHPALIHRERDRG